MDIKEQMTPDEAFRQFDNDTLNPEDLAGNPGLIAGLFMLIRLEFDSLKHQVASLSRHTFGRRSEAFDPRQGLLFESRLSELLGKVQRIEQERGEAARQAKPAESVPEKPRRQKIPEHLPVVTRVHELPEAERTCEPCQRVMTEISEEVSEKVGILKVVFKIREVQKVYGCEECHEGVLTAPAPPQVVDGGKFDRTFLASVVTAKYADHVPLYRQSEILGRDGLEVSRSTLCDQVTRVADLLEPVADQVQKEVLAAPYLQTDDTPVVMETKGRPQGKNSIKTYLWPYLAGPGLVFFDFTLDHSGKRPIAVLREYEGYVQTDGHKGYDPLFRMEKARRLGCNAHARRKFHYALNTHHNQAVLGLGFYRELYAIEEEARLRGLTPQERWALRQEKAPPIWAAFQAWLELEKRVVLPKSALGKAIHYTLNEWEFLIRYLEDGRLEIDNNQVENVIRPIAVGRKNWLMLGSEEGGRRAATLMTLIACCRGLQLDPRLYIWDVLARVARCPAAQVHDLTPLGWQARFQSEAEAAFAGLRQEVLAALSNPS